MLVLRIELRCVGTYVSVLTGPTSNFLMKMLKMCSQISVLLQYTQSTNPETKEIANSTCFPHLHWALPNTCVGR